MDRDIRYFIETFIIALKEGNAAIFAGSGLSIDSGYVNWKELMRDIAEELGLDVDKESDLIEIAQFYKNKIGTRSTINQRLIDHFTKKVKASENHKLLSKLPIKTYWTTNYDNLIEKSLEDEGKIVDVKLTPENLSYVKKKRDAVVYKMHGDISLPNEAVLTKDDYECYNEKRQMFTTALQGDLVNKTFLFWGFSFDDPNLEYILSRIKILLGENSRNHYCFFRKVNKEDFKNEDESFNEEEYIYAKTKQKLKIEDLKRYSISALLVDEYSEITDIFRIIYRRLKEDKIFISGAAEQYGPWEKSNAEKFIYKLSQKIVENNLKVVSGFGLGVGSSVINGVLSYVYSTKGTKMDECLTLKPFPQNIENDKQRKELWHKYREDMLSDVGIVIFLFGNKMRDRELINSIGMIEEFEIAVENEAIIIPVGCTGYTSKDIWERVINDPQKYYGDNPELIENIRKLGQESIDNIDNIIDIILKTIKIIKDKGRKRI